MLQRFSGNDRTLARSLTTIGIRNAALLLAEVRHFRGNDSDVYLAHADDGTCVCLYGRTASVESNQDTDTINSFIGGTRSDALTYMLSVRLWERPGTYVFVCGTGEKVRVTFRGG